MEFEPGRIEAEVGSEGSRPDLTIHDTDGHVRVFVENKFWAPLTEAQPVSYLRSLPEYPESALVFVVPEKRVATVWQELKERCKKEGLECEDLVKNGQVRKVRVGSNRMLITNWNHVLEKLLNAAGSLDEVIQHDIHQLQGLVNRVDSSDEFLPLRDEDVTDQGTARRLINFIGLIDPIVEKLQQDGIATRKRSQRTNIDVYTGRYFYIHDEIQLLLKIDYKMWRDHGITPLWLWINHDQTFQRVRGLFPNMEFEGHRYFPIRLKSGVERERVIENAAEQIRQIVDHCREPAPQDSPSGN